MALREEKRAHDKTEWDWWPLVALCSGGKAGECETASEERVGKISCRRMQVAETRWSRCFFVLFDIVFSSRIIRIILLARSNNREEFRLI